MTTENTTSAITKVKGGARLQKEEYLLARTIRDLQDKISSKLDLLRNIKEVLGGKPLDAKKFQSSIPDFKSNFLKLIDVMEQYNQMRKLWPADYNPYDTSIAEQIKCIVSHPEFEFIVELFLSEKPQAVNTLRLAAAAFDSNLQSVILRFKRAIISMLDLLEGPLGKEKFQSSITTFKHDFSKLIELVSEHRKYLNPELIAGIKAEVLCHAKIEVMRQLVSGAGPQIELLRRIVASTSEKKEEYPLAQLAASLGKFKPPDRLPSSAPDQLITTAETPGTIPTTTAPT